MTCLPEEGTTTTQPLESSDDGFYHKRPHLQFQQRRPQHRNAELTQVDQNAKFFLPSSHVKVSFEKRSTIRLALVIVALFTESFSTSILPNVFASRSSITNNNDWISFGHRRSGFVYLPNTTRSSHAHHLRNLFSHKTPHNRPYSNPVLPDVRSGRDTMWSNAVRQRSERNESRFGVRRRVKSVLDKAKKRTGIDGSSGEAKDSQPSFSGSILQRPTMSYEQILPNVVAEVASIGGIESMVSDEEVSGVETHIHLSKENDRKYSGANELSDKLRSDVYSLLGDGAPTIYGTDVKPTDDAIIAPSSSTANELKELSPKESRNGSGYSNSKSDFSNKVVLAGSPTPSEPLPFTLPTLDDDQYRRVIRGERVQFQDDMGRAGSGFVVWDVRAPPSVVWDCLLDFSSYPQTIPTVREVVMYTKTEQESRNENPQDFEDGTAAICKHGVPSVTRAQFSLSKFRLKIAAIHKYRPHSRGDYMIFTLDPASSNIVLKYAKGIWHTQSNPDGKEGYTRVWLLCELKVSRLLPQWIVDYAAARAMPRATSWLKPQVEAAATLWLKNSSDN